MAVMTGTGPPCFELGAAVRRPLIVSALSPGLDCLDVIKLWKTWWSMVHGDPLTSWVARGLWRFYLGYVTWHFIGDGRSKLGVVFFTKTARVRECSEPAICRKLTVLAGDIFIYFMFSYPYISRIQSPTVLALYAIQELLKGVRAGSG